MDFVHAKPVEATLFYRLWNAMPVHNHHIVSQFVTLCHILSHCVTFYHILSHFVTFCHILSHFVTNRHGGAEPGIHVGNSPAQNLLVFSNVLSTVSNKTDRMFGSFGLCI